MAERASAHEIYTTTLAPVFDVASKAESGDFNHSLQHEHWSEEKVEDLESEVKLLNIAYNDDDLTTNDWPH